MFTLSNEEFLALYEYLMKRAGYISHEFDSAIWKLIRRMSFYAEKVKNDVDKRSIEKP